VKDTSRGDYRQIKIVMLEHEDRIFEVKRRKGGGKLY